MPSGRTHDRITMWGLPLVTAFTLGLTRSGNLTLIVSGGFLFSGLMFGPDLDLLSLPYKRWGLLRWIWIPYQKMLRHRSLFSHGPILGTTVRVLYLAGWLGIALILGAAIAQLIWGVGWSWLFLVGESIKRSLSTYLHEWIALIIGLELGAMSHSVSDWGNSAYKSFKKQGWSMLLRGKMKKRKASGVSRQSRRGTVKRRSK